MCWSFISGVKQLLAAIKAAKALHAEESDAAGREAAVGSPRDPGPGAWGRPKQKPIRRQTDWQQKDHTVDVDEHLHPMSSIGVPNHYQWHPMTSVLQSWVNIRKSSFTTATCKKSFLPGKGKLQVASSGMTPKSPAKIVLSHKSPIDFMYQAPNFLGQQVTRQRKRIGTVICFAVQDS